jgi:hypothetical protein
MHLPGNAAMLLGPICQHASYIEALRQQRASKNTQLYGLCGHAVVDSGAARTS